MSKITIKVVPASGSPSSKDADIPATGCSLKDIADKGILSLAAGFQYAIDGEPVSDSELAKPARVHVPAGATVTATEKARGS